MKKLLGLLITIAAVAGYTSCKKTPDRPPLTDHHIKVYSVTELKAIASCTGTCQKRFNTNVYFVGVVIADEVSGNFYKEVYLRDRYNTGAIHIDLTSGSCNYFIGDSIRINLNGLDVNFNADTDILEIDSLDCEKHSMKFASGANPQPIQVTLGSNYSDYLGDLIQLNGVGFIPADTNKIYADVIAQTSGNRTIQDCGGSQLIVRTSNYAKFASEKTPKGNGTIIGIATAYLGTNQLAIRTTKEVNMNGSGCTVYHKKDWNDNNLTSGGWLQQSVVDPAVQWTASTFSTYQFAKISGFYSSANHASENWLISPAINLSSASNPVLTFVTAAKFAGNVLEVKVSTNYVSGDPNLVTWTPLTGYSLSPNNPGSYAWTNSGLVSLAAFKNANTRIAFKYTSTTSASTTYELDDVVIREN